MIYLMFYLLDLPSVVLFYLMFYYVSNKTVKDRIKYSVYSILYPFVFLYMLICGCWIHYKGENIGR